VKFKAMTSFAFYNPKRIIAGNQLTDWVMHRIYI